MTYLLKHDILCREVSYFSLKHLELPLQLTCAMNHANTTFKIQTNFNASNKSFFPIFPQCKS